MIDTPILMDERFQALKMRNSKLHDNQSNRVAISLYQNCLPRDSYDQFSKIQELDFCNIGISSIQVDSFVSLQVLLLKNNPILSFENISGLIKLTSLRILDIRNCNIQKWSSSFEYNLIHSLVELKSLGISGNPFCNEWMEYRSYIIEKLNFQQSHLQVIDEIPISIDEFLDASSDHNKKLRIAITRAVSKNKN